MASLEVGLLVLKLLSAIGIGVLTITSARSYYRRNDRPMAFLAAGLGTMGIGAVLAVLGGVSIGFVDTVWLIESAFLSVGIGLILVSIWID